LSVVVALLSCLAFAARVDDDSSDAQAPLIHTKEGTRLRDNQAAEAQAAQDAELGASLAKYNGMLQPDDLPVISQVDEDLKQHQHLQEEYEKRQEDDSDRVHQQLAENKAVVTAEAAAAAKQKLREAHKETEEAKRIQLEDASRQFHADYVLKRAELKADAAQEAKTESEVVRAVVKKEVDVREAALSHAKMQASEAMDRAKQSAEAVEVLGLKRDHSMAQSIMAQQQAFAAAEADEKLKRQLVGACQEAHIAHDMQAHLAPIVTQTAITQSQKMEHLAVAQDNEVSLQTQRAELLKSQGVVGDELSWRTTAAELKQKELLKAARLT
jgi:hypothetical protein